jgi:hypothetical protein
MKIKIVNFVILLIATFPVFASGQTGLVMTVIYGGVILTSGLLVTTLFFMWKKIRDISRKGHIYVCLLVEGKKIEVKADSVDKQFFDHWASRMGIDSYEVLSVGKIFDAQECTVPFQGQEFEIIVKNT